MRHLFAGGAIAVIGLLSSDAFACFEDPDCPKGSRCVILFGEREGLCEYGLLPGEPGRIVVDPAHGNTTEGKRCMENGDCDEGLTCEPQDGNFDRRICVR